MTKAIVNFAVTDLSSLKALISKLRTKYPNSEDFPLIMAHALNPVDLASIVEYSKTEIAQHPELHQKLQLGLSIPASDGFVVAYSDGGVNSSGDETMRELIGYYNRATGTSFEGLADALGVSAPGTYKPAAALAAAKRIVGHNSNGIDGVLTSVASDLGYTLGSGPSCIPESEYPFLINIAMQRAPLDHEVLSVMSYLMGHVSSLGVHAGAVFFNQGRTKEGDNILPPTISEMAASGLNIVADPAHVSVDLSTIKGNVLVHGRDCDASPKFAQHADAIAVLTGEDVHQEPLEIYFADLRKDSVKNLPSAKTGVLGDLEENIEDVNISLKNSPPCLLPPANEWPMFECPSPDAVARALEPEVIDRIVNGHRDFVAADGKLSSEEVEIEVARYRDEEVIPRLNSEMAIMREASDYLGLDVVSYFLPSAAMIGNARNVYGGSSIGTGRGSGAGSMWAQGLGLTTVDPIRHKLIFARFITVERLCDNLVPLFASLTKKFPDVFVPTSKEDYKSPVNRPSKMETLRKHLTTLGSDYASDPIFSEFASFLETNGHPTELEVLNYALSSDLDAASINKYVGHALNGLRGNMPDLDLDLTTSLRDKIIEDSGKIWHLLVSSADSNKNVTAWIRRCINVGMPSEELDQRLQNAPAAPYDIPPLWKQSVLMKGSEEDSGIVLGMKHKLAEKMGQIKFDMLGLTEGDKITVSDKYISERTGEKLVDIRNIESYLKGRPDTIKKMKHVLELGVNPEMFQFTSDSGLSLLQKLVIALGDRMELLDIISLASALNRPGPLDQDMDKMILAKANGEAVDEKSYERLPLYQECTKDTFGAMVYQEQVMALSVQFAGYSEAESDELRAAMGKKNITLMNKHRIKFLAQSTLGIPVSTSDHRLAGVVDKYAPGADLEQLLADAGIATDNRMEAETYSLEDMSALFDGMAAFAEYGFNKSHALAYAIYPYMTLYLAATYPKEFITCVLQTQSDPNIPRLTQLAEALGGELVLPTAAHTNTEVAQVGNQIRLPLTQAKNVTPVMIDKMELLPEEERCLSSILTAVQVKLDPIEDGLGLEPKSLAISADFSDSNKEAFAKALGVALTSGYKISGRAPLFTEGQIGDLLSSGALDRHTPNERAKFDLGSYRIPSFVKKLSKLGSASVKPMSSRLTSTALNKAAGNKRAFEGLSADQVSSLVLAQVVEEGCPSFEECISDLKVELPPITADEVSTVGRNDLVYCAVTPDPFVTGSGYHLIKLSLRDLHTNHVHEVMVFDSVLDQYAQVAGIKDSDLPRGTAGRPIGQRIMAEIASASGKKDTNRYSVLRPYMSAFVLKQEISKRSGQIEDVIDWKGTMDVHKKLLASRVSSGSITLEEVDLSSVTLLQDPQVDVQPGEQAALIRHKTTRKTKAGKDYEVFEITPMFRNTKSGGAMSVNLFGRAPAKFMSILGGDLEKLKKGEQSFYAPLVLDLSGRFPNLDLAGTETAVKRATATEVTSAPQSRGDMNVKTAEKSKDKDQSEPVKGL